MTQTAETHSPTINAYEAAHAPLTDLIHDVPSEAWQADSPCDGWTARDVVVHMIDSQYDFLTSHGVDLGPSTREEPDTVAAWDRHSAAIRQAIADDEAMAATFEGHFGTTGVGDTFVRFYVWDMIPHRWDIARSAGRDTTFSPAELDLLEAGIDGFGDALYMDGICQCGVTAPEGADRQTTVLARLGRQA
ncbi:maleylpyruvate isomerase family mycothiol-dependent enzyme [Propionibacteriaceae bacterium Y2011]